MALTIRPYAAGMALDDELLNKVTWKITNALALIGSRAGDERNAMTASWITQLSMEPVLIGVAVDNEAITCRLITDGGSFTVNLWDASDTRVFVKFSKPAVDDGSTFKGMTDELLRWQTTELQTRAIAIEGHTMHVRPELVVEIALDGVQRSTRYPGGVALRFARVRRYRPDKAANQADTIERVQAMLGGVR